MSITARADARVLQAIVQLDGHPDFDALRDYLRRQLVLEEQATLNAVEGYAAMKQIGREALLTEVLQLISDARARLEAFENRVVPRNTPVRATDAY
jgi:hypothetical protein